MAQHRYVIKAADGKIVGKRCTWTSAVRLARKHSADRIVGAGPEQGKRWHLRDLES